MNKQRYLAELQRLLVFMTETDRAEVIRRCSELFDAAGPGGEADVIALAGSPTKAAISLSKGYEPGTIPDVLPGADALPRAAEPAPAATQEITEGASSWEEDIPAFDIPLYAQDDSPEEPAPSAGSEEPFTIPDLPGTIRPEADPADDAGKRVMPLGIGIPLFVIIMAAIGLPLAALCLLAAAALLMPGAALIFAAWLVFVGGLWCLSFIADAILLFGAAFIVLALGILVLFAGLRLGVKLVSLYVRGVSLLVDVFFFRRRSTAHE